MRPSWLWLVLPIACGSCLAIVGLDEDYVLGGTNTSTTSSGGSGGTASSGGGGTSAQGGAPNEDCLDGVDNDDDGLVDCADPVCQPDHECVPLPPVPSSWTGYYILDTQLFPAEPPPLCPDGENPEILFEGPGAPARCSACGCDAPGGSCTHPEMGLWTNTSSCSGIPDYALAPADGNCHGFPVNCGSTCSSDQRVQITQSSTLSGASSCAPSGGAATLTPLWNSEHHACGMPVRGGGGCDTGMACVSKGESFGGACVRRDGDEMCPTEWQQVVAYQSADDTRDCSACTCDASGVACTGGSFVVSDDGSCNGGSTPDVTVSGTSCVSVQQHLDGFTASYQANAGTVTGSCVPDGGAPVGGVTPHGPVTFCCL
jgi:hypothetical protein